TAQVVGEKLRLSHQHRRDREAAMANYLGGDSLPHFAFRFRIDRQDEVGVSLDIDKARRHREALRIDDFFSLAGERRTDRSDAAVGESKIADGARPVAAPVNERAPTDQDVPGHGSLRGHSALRKPDYRSR